MNNVKGLDRRLTISEPLLAWYEQHGRKNLPWQLDNTPYHTWLSEIMLQQTQVKTVIPYYQSFTQRFPTIKQLAETSIDEVLHLWTGLGYYTRARNLHRCAQIIQETYGGVFPNSITELEALPGIGRSTAGAIASLSMGMSEPILDGNVKRVFCRIKCIDGWSGDTKVQKQLWSLAEELLPKTNTKNYNQSLMDLGATVCKRSKPLCQQCPLRQICEAYKTDTQGQYPVSKPKKAIPTKHCHILVLQNTEGAFRLEQRPSQGIWGGLWSFPEFENHERLRQHCHESDYVIQKEQTLDSISHRFSHYQLIIHPILCTIEKEPDKIAEAKTLWYRHEHKEQKNIGLATPIKKLIEDLEAKP